jgi:plastocyanin
MLHTGLVAIVLCVHPSFAMAHGDTVRVSYASVAPERLVVKVGTTVHFHNANASGAPCTIVFADGTTKSPALGRAEGWHHTFDEPGEYDFQLAEYPSRKGVVVVVAPAGT